MNNDIRTFGSSPLTGEALVEHVMSSLKRKSVPREVVEEVVSALDISMPNVHHPAPHLHIKRLIFTGEKRLGEQEEQPFRYDQHFAPGVNIVFIEDNDVGKSSILKTIKYALTGDDGDYDIDVKSWIKNIWLQFALDGTTFTVHITREEGNTRAYIALEAQPESGFTQPLSRQSETVVA